MIFASIKNKALRITAWVFSSFLLLVVLLLVAVNIYIAFNKESLLNSVKQAIANNTSGKLEIKDIDISTISTFPNIAVNLEKVELLDSVYKMPFLKCRVLSCRINIFKIGDVQHQLSKVVLEDGTIHLYTDSTGYSNLSMFSKPGKEKKEAGEGFMIHTVELENMAMLINNEQKKKDFEFHVTDLVARLNQKDSLLQMNIEEKLVVKKMIFNRAKGSYLENNSVEGKMRLNFNSAAKTLSCEKSDIEINEQPYSLSGVFSFAQDPSFHLDIQSDHIKYEKAIAALTPKLSTKLNSIQIKEPLAVQVMLEGPLAPGKIPVVAVNWQTQENQLSSGPVTFDECAFTGNFSNNISDTLPHTDEFSIITMQTFSGKWHGLQLNSKFIKVTNLKQPILQFDFSSFASLGDIDNAIGSDDISFLEGTASVGLTYNGPLVADPAQLKSLNASLRIKDGKLLYEPKNILLEKCSGLLSIEDNGLLFKDFQFDFKRNHFTLNVQGNDMGNLSKTTKQKATLLFNIQSPYIHLDEIFQVLAPSERKAAKKRKAHFASTAKKIDTLLDNSTWIINLSADKLSKGNFYAEKLATNLRLEDKTWNIDKLSLYHAGGAITASGKLFRESAKASLVKADVNLQQLNIQKLFYGLNNFGQTSLTSANLRGVLNADAHINMSISNNNGAVIPRSMSGIVNFSLKNGAIINHKGLEEMKILFLKNRDMSNVRFAELKDRIDITPQYLYINRMEIQSTAISMYLEGKFDIYAKNTDLLIQVPFSNFGKRDETVPVKNKGLDAKTGLSIWIGAKNDQYGEIKFTPRLSRKKFKQG